MRSATHPFNSFTESQPTASLMRWSGMMFFDRGDQLFAAADPGESRVGWCTVRGCDRGFLVSFLGSLLASAVELAVRRAGCGGRRASAALPVPGSGVMILT